MVRALGATAPVHTPACAKSSNSASRNSLRQASRAARRELENRKELDRVREYLPLYFDPSRRQTVFGPGAALTSQAAIEGAIQPGKPVRAIAAG
jgi:hypothetical protein